MKKLSVFFVLLFLSVNSYAQVQGPPPIGYLDYHICDSNEDGVEIFDLVSHFIFPFHQIGEDPDNYYPLTFYLTKEDRDNEVNQIINTTSFVNTSISQRIYFRAYAINPGMYEYLDNDSTINVESFPSLNREAIEVSCKDNVDGENIFNLNACTGKILAGLNSVMYNSSFYENLSDAENEVNRITNITSYSNTLDSQLIYVRVAHQYAPSCNAIVPLELIGAGECKDIEVLLVSYRSPRPGFAYHNYLRIRNTGTQTVSSGSIEFTHDPLLTFSFVSLLDAGNLVTNTATGFVLDFVNFKPNDYETIKIHMSLPVPTPLGTLLTNTAKYNVSDLNNENSTSSLSEVVIGSYDPNDIMESHGPEILHADFNSNDYLYYTVRFQNVGTADAINVSIDNTLDSRLDKSTIQMLSSSHTNVFTRTDNQLNWQFDNIHLPSEDMDEPNSHGYVYYKIKPTAGYSVGDIIPNTAEIYFDFNPAVITNTFETEFTEEVALSSKKLDKFEFYVSPNPARNIIELNYNKSLGNIINIEIYNIQGKLILSREEQSKGKITRLDVSSLKAGMYFINVNDDFKTSTQKLIIK